MSRKRDRCDRVCNIETRSTSCSERCLSRVYTRLFSLLCSPPITYNAYKDQFDAAITKLHTTYRTISILALFVVSMPFYNALVDLAQNPKAVPAAVIIKGVSQLTKNFEKNALECDQIQNCCCSGVLIK